MATWGETGIGILYSQATGAHVCFSRAQNYYVALNAYHFPGPRSMTMGDVVLKPDLALPRESLNPFERLAGLESGGYTPSGTGPVLGPAQLAVLSVLGGVIVSAPFVVRRRRAAARSRGQH